MEEKRSLVAYISYSLFLAAMGIQALVSAGSQISFFISTGFALSIAITALLKQKWPPLGLLFFLSCFFLVKTLKTHLFYPSGLLLVISASVLIFSLELLYPKPSYPLPHSNRRSLK